MYKKNNQGWNKHIDFILWDALSLQVAFILVYLIRHGSRFPSGSTVYRTLAIMLFVVGLLIAAIFNTMHNVLKRGFCRETVQTLKQTLLVLVVTTLFMFSTQSGDA